MIPSRIPVSQLAPRFTLSQAIPHSAPITSLLLGQQRLLSAIRMAAKLPQQRLYIADFPGINRSLLLQALVAEQQVQHWQYLSGQLTRQQLIGQRDKLGQWQNGALAKPQWLFICAESLMRRENLWELLLHCLEQGAIELSDGSRIPIQAKLVLIGGAEIYAGLKYQEGRFNQFFPLLGELAQEVDINQHPVEDYCNFLVALANAQQLTLNKDAIAPLLAFSAKLTEHQQRLSLMTDELVQVLAQAASFCEQQSLSAEQIEQALAAKIFRHNTSEQFSAQSFDDAFINLPTEGEAIGQINGLTVIDSVDFSYGEPARITASVHYGDGEVADIERKSELGGNIHAKGMMILSACLYRIFGRDAPLHLSANIVFEQSYQEIDGDSASLAEYCCLMSAIAEKPILQSFAVTGALDQQGNVQAIGGVNEKIEGFFNLCQRRGLTGSQGVLLPRANLLQLNLPKRIIDAVADGKFHLFQISHMDEAVELLMQLPAGKADAENDFPPETLYGLVQQRLDKLAGNDDEMPLSFWQRIGAKLGFLSW
ncbi:ATP-dependent protease [Shewanella sp. NFH-SH190041]|uniref:Lon-insertion domain-containing protein n=1 Tax=Shewanella sp. NFH-SH190041 TaxID=2950245 RepID=UPI0021C47049|nr:Lon-insertion domain-containing protein [Shewanella sp. NFH-SH190041]BDM64890.1 ATP-dependent protease [Shewanella sp. NFH-SH190041]